MNKIIRFLQGLPAILWMVVTAAALILLQPLVVLAQESGAPAGFDWLTPILQFLLGIPKVGPILAQIFEVVAIVGAVFTYLTVAAIAILSVPELAARWAGAHGLADKIKKVSDVVVPWLKYFSIFNRQKKQ